MAGKITLRAYWTVGGFNRNELLDHIKNELFVHPDCGEIIKEEISRGLFSNTYRIVIRGQEDKLKVIARMIEDITND